MKLVPRSKACRARRRKLTMGLAGFDLGVSRSCAGVMRRGAGMGVSSSMRAGGVAACVAAVGGGGIK